MGKPVFLYKGEFNWKGQIYTEYTHAYSERQAFVRICNRLGTKVGRPGFAVYNYFKDTDRYRLKEQTK